MKHCSHLHFYRYGSKSKFYFDLNPLYSTIDHTKFKSLALTSIFPEYFDLVKHCYQLKRSSIAVAFGTFVTYHHVFDFHSDYFTIDIYES